MPDPKGNRMRDQTPEEIRQRRIRQLNDDMRRHPLSSALGRLVITQSVAAYLTSAPDLMPQDGQARWLFLLRALADFKDFDAAGDPYQEHDFGIFPAWGQHFFFKIDYYDKACANGSPDPADPAVTTRILTIGFADEY